MTIRKYLFLLVVLLLAGKPGFAQGWKPHEQLTGSEILHQLQKLNNTGSALYIAAHPDDENTRLIAWLANEAKVRTGYLSLTRGDGGQNLIGSEQGEALGVIRTQELLAARHLDGGEQFFTRAYDFGFSKNPEETFRIWNRDSVLADVVWTIRKFRPDVIITRFPTTGEGGHGHHTASAILAVEAFDAAADPTRFPDQLQYVSVWQAKRLFWNTFNFGGNDLTRPDQLKIDVGGYNPLLGKSYGEIAASARSMHKSQGFGSAPQRGSSLEYFKLLKGSPATTGLFEGVDLSWSRIPKSEPIAGEIAGLINNYEATAPQKSLPALTALYKKLSTAEAVVPAGERSFWEGEKKAVANLIQQVAGLSAEALVARENISEGEATRADLTAIVRTTGALSLAPAGRSAALALTQNKAVEDSLSRTIPVGTLPATYWLSRARPETGIFATPPVPLRNAAQAPGPELSADLMYESTRIPISIPLVTRKIDPVAGALYAPVQLVPAVTLEVLARSAAFENFGPKTLYVRIESHTNALAGQLLIETPAGWKTDYYGGQINLPRRGFDTTIAVRVTPQRGAADAGYLKAAFVSPQGRFSKTLRTIAYPHIPTQSFTSPASIYINAFDLKRGGTNIGYIAGAGDEVPAALKQVGYTITELDEAAVKSGNLSRYDAIVTGVRAYNTKDWLEAAHTPLMNYVKGGGNLIVQYNTNNRNGPMRSQIGPDSFTITRDRVTDETAEVEFLQPAHPAVNVPNKITGPDFAGWYQERGIYFASNWGKTFVPIFGMADAGEKTNEGSLIIAPFGKGNFVYTGLAFFRELPAGVPGAYRLFANLLALPKGK